MSDCFLEGQGTCSGKLTGEHYISKTVLQAIGGGTVQIGGVPWVPEGTLNSVGIGSLVSNILCEGHNSSLSKLDSEAGTLFRALDAADKKPESLASVTTVDGPLVERWFLKVMCGLAAAVGFNDGTVPDSWKQALTGGAWSEAWGLYVPVSIGSNVLATEFYLETLVQNGTKTVKAAKFRVAGVHFSLLLGRPDHPEAWGVNHPRWLTFRAKGDEKRIEFAWPSVSDGEIVYTKVGVSMERARQWREWKE